MIPCGVDFLHHGLGQAALKRNPNQFGTASSCWGSTQRAQATRGPKQTPLSRCRILWIGIDGFRFKPLTDPPGLPLLRTRHQRSVNWLTEAVLGGGRPRYPATPHVPKRTGSPRSARPRASRRAGSCAAGPRASFEACGRRVLQGGAFLSA